MDQESKKMLKYPEERFEEFQEYPEKVTICLPVFNGGENLSRCLESIEKQTYQNFNLIIVDNQSTDQSYKIACEYADKHLNTLVIKNNANLGRVGNWNKCKELVFGDYFKPVMVNDILLPHCLETLAGILNEYPDVDMVSCALASKEADEKVYVTQFLQQSAIIPGKVALMHGLFHGNVSGGPTGQMIRKSVLEENSIKFDERFKAVCDFDFSLKIFKVCKSYAYTTDALYVFDNTTERFHTKSNQVDYFEEEYKLRRIAIEEYGLEVDSSLVNGLKTKVEITYKICKDRLTTDEDKSKIDMIYTEAVSYFDSVLTTLQP